MQMALRRHRTNGGENGREKDEERIKVRSVHLGEKATSLFEEKQRLRTEIAGGAAIARKTVARFGAGAGAVEAGVAAERCKRTNRTH